MIWKLIPLFGWFDMKEENDVVRVVCQIYKTNIQRRDASTGQMTQHLKRHHNFMKEEERAAKQQQK